MFELLWHLAEMLLPKTLRAKWPDPRDIWGDLQSGKRKVHPTGDDYISVCRLTGLASVIRTVAITCVVVLGVVIARHGSLNPFPVNFAKNPDNIFLEASFSAMTPRATEFCELSGTLCSLILVASSMAFGFIDWLIRGLIPKEIEISKPKPKSKLKAKAAHFGG
jgi:hypothetical protein